MAQHYSNPTRANDAYSLPDVETFYVSSEEFLKAPDGSWQFERMSDNGAADAEDTDYPATIGPELRRIASELAGWYYWFCFPGCLPDSEPIGPFATEADALEDARQYNEDDADDDDAIAEHCRQFAAHVDPDDDDAI